MDWKDTLANLLDSDTLEQVPKQEAPAQPSRTKRLPRLRLILDKRKGKTATIVLGMENEDEDTLNDLARTLKTRLAVGGSVRDGEILLQGDVREKVRTILLDLEYRV